MRGLWPEVVALMLSTGLGCSRFSGAPRLLHLGGCAQGVVEPVVLSLGDEHLTVLVDGNFAFKGSFLPGSPYAVRILQQPAVTTCTLLDAQGTFDVDDVTKVALRCAPVAQVTEAPPAPSAPKLGGTLRDLPAGETVVLRSGSDSYTLSSNGNFVLGTLPMGSAYALYVAQQPRHARCHLQGPVQGAVAGDVTFSLRCRDFVVLSSGQAAAVVLGQPDFTSGYSNQSQNADANTLAQPAGNPSWLDDTLVIPDAQNSRLLGFVGLPTTTDQAADVVYGQPDFLSNNFGISATQYNAPRGLLKSGTNFVVIDLGNSRVLLYDQIPVADAVMARHVLGQVDMASRAMGCSPNSYIIPTDALVLNGGLMVADPYCHRAHVYDAWPTADGQPGDWALGESYDPNQIGATQMDPSGLATVDGRLLVVDSTNNRVLIWNAVPTDNLTPADVVLGQVDLHGTAAGVGADQLSAPTLVATNGEQVAVADGSSRVLIWNQFPTVSGTAADVVVGQPDFISAHQANTQTGLGYATGLLFAHQALVVSDGPYSRVLIYRSLPAI